MQGLASFCEPALWPGHSYSVISFIEKFVYDTPRICKHLYAYQLLLFIITYYHCHPYQLFVNLHHLGIVFIHVHVVHVNANIEPVAAICKQSVEMDAASSRGRTGDSGFAIGGVSVGIAGSKCNLVLLVSCLRGLCYSNN